MSVMEAMAAGLPVVSTAVGGVPELVRAGETGLLVPSEDAAALAQAMQALVDDPVRRQAMGAAARQHAVAHFDIRHTVRGYEQLYESLLKGGQHRLPHQSSQETAVDDPLLQVPPARRGSRTLARFPSRSGGNLRRGAIVNFDGVVGKCLCVGFSTCPPSQPSLWTGEKLRLPPRLRGGLGWGRDV